jgi:hypothetical protein
VRFLLLTSLAALALAACGGSGTSKNDYVKSLNKAEAALQKSLQDVGGAVNASGGGTAVAAKLQAGGKALDDAADNFNTIKPPSDAKHAHGEIVDGLHKLAGTFREAASAAKANDLTKAASTLSGALSGAGAQEIQKAQDELKAAGYKVQD